MKKLIALMMFCVLAGTAFAWNFYAPGSATPVANVETVEGLLAAIREGTIPVTNKFDIDSYYSVRAPNSESERSQFKILVTEWANISTADKRAGAQDSCRIKIR